MDQKLFILVRSDLSIAQQAVQAAHVAAVFAAVDHLYPPDWHKVPLVLVSVPDEKELRLWIRKTDIRALFYQVFTEPGVGITALACLHDGNLFDKLPLWNP